MNNDEQPLNEQDGMDGKSPSTAGLGAMLAAFEAEYGSRPGGRQRETMLETRGQDLWDGLYRAYSLGWRDAILADVPNKV